ncbi:hypothetical protein BSG8_20260 [Bacillus subtilis subsp. natto]|nr:hypothetical protein BSG8_20260 [Bacillus subtilis subsp. natto]BEH06081.1 hypothetical protein BSNN_21140 [Bacillus subtilis subsp. natto]
MYIHINIEENNHSLLAKKAVFFYCNIFFVCRIVRYFGEKAVLFTGKSFSKQLFRPLD